VSHLAGPAVERPSRPSPCRSSSPRGHPPSARRGLSAVAG